LPTGDSVHILDNDARIKQGFTAFHHETRHFAQGVGFGNGGIRRPDVFLDELVVQLFFGHDGANFADIRTGDGTYQFHTFNVVT